MVEEDVGKVGVGSWKVVLGWRYISGGGVVELAEREELKWWGR